MKHRQQKFFFEFKLVLMLSLICLKFIFMHVLYFQKKLRKMSHTEQKSSCVVCTKQRLNCQVTAASFRLIFQEIMKVKCSEKI